MSYPNIERLSTDSTPLFFSWLSNTALTATASISGDAPQAVSGAITFVRAEGANYIFRLAYNINDRPALAGVVRYAITDGLVTRYLSLYIEPACVDDEAESGSGSVSILSVFAGGAEGVITLSDMVAALEDRAGTFQDIASDSRKLTRAIRAALRDLPSLFDWSYFTRVYRFKTTAARSIASLVYDSVTGNATISNGETTTWPADAVYGEVKIGSVRCAIASRTDDKVVVIAISSRPAANSIGKATWSRSEFSIPEVRRIQSLWEEASYYRLEYMSPSDLHEYDSIRSSPASPVYFSVAGGARTASLRLSPSPLAEKSYRMIANIAPAPAEVFRDVATVTAMAGVRTMTITEAKPSWVGTVLRLTSNPGNADLGRQKIIDGEFAEWQAVIVGVSGTAVVVDAAPPGALAGVHGLVSSVVDVSVTMQTFFENLCYAYFCRNHRHDGLAEAMQIADMTQREAQAADSMANRTSRTDRVPMLGGLFDMRPLSQL